MPIKRITLDELFGSAGFFEVRDAYERECGRAFWGVLRPDVRTYKWLEGRGQASAIGAYSDDDKLAGFAIILLAKNLATGEDFSTIDYIFVLPEFRKELGAALFRAALKSGLDSGRECLLSAQCGSRLDAGLKASHWFEPQETIYRFRR